MIERELISRYGSPIYVYDEKILSKKVEDLLKLKKYLQNQLNIKVSMHYSTKANNNLRLLKIIKDLGMQADSMSPVELQLALKAGFRQDDMIYVCNNVSQEEMKYVVDQDILICMDSIEQIKMLGEVRPNTKIMIRINPEEGGVGHSDKVITSGKDARFGITEKDFQELIDTAKKYNMEIIGIHQHLGSCFLNEDIEKYILGLKKGIDLVKKYFPNISIIDLGGGFGIPYDKNNEKLDFELFGEKISDILKEILKNTNIKEIKFEPGRYVICESGYILGTINSYKQSFSKKWIGTDVGMNVLIRPELYGAKHRIEVVKDNNKYTEEYIEATISGNICESGDVLGENVRVLKPEVGDIIKIYDAGAYGYCMSSAYTGRLTVAEVLINKDSKDELIRRRETIEDVLSRF